MAGLGHGPMSAGVMVECDIPGRVGELTKRLAQVRARTEALAQPLSPEDQTVQTMPDVSPTKWHRAHTSWFFETFLLEPFHSGYHAFHPAYGYLFNSYYEAVGSRHPRATRGYISRPGAEEIGCYRSHVDDAMQEWLGQALDEEALDLVELGIHHEQQHQELLLMDAKHVLSSNPLLPAYTKRPCAVRPVARLLAESSEKPGWMEHTGGPVEVGTSETHFTFDNERPRHIVQLTPFALADRPVTCGEWLAFMEDGGYQRPELWLSDGWIMVQQEGWRAPLYWAPNELAPWEEPGGADDGAASLSSGWNVFSLHGSAPVQPDDPVCHVSYYEADAFAHWAGARLPTEAEWEAVAAQEWDPGSQGWETLDEAPPENELFHPRIIDERGNYGQVWEWTASAYSAYPGFRPASGAVGEYNGKFMVNQYVLRGGCCVTPARHIRPTYRNFFPPSARWVFSGLRLARDL